jgi:hypothetical protein
LPDEPLRRDDDESLDTSDDASLPTLDVPPPARRDSSRSRFESPDGPPDDPLIPE